MRDGLELRQVEICRNTVPLISVSQHIAPGSVLVVMGPSGVGKSTLLSAIIGRLDPGFSMSGQILLNGEDLSHAPPQDRHIGILFQDALLFPHLSVGANMAFGLPPGGSKMQRRDTVEQALSEVDLQGFYDRDPATLSGGQRARVALMRMLLSDPKALLLDEPFSGLDAGLRHQIRQLVFDHAKARDLPVVLVTHDQADARSAGAEILTLG